MIIRTIFEYLIKIYVTVVKVTIRNCQNPSKD